MPSLIVAAIALVIAALSPPEARAGAAAEQACGHYANRAFAKSRTADVEFVTVLAEACAAARAALADPATPPAQRVAAADYLDRVAHVRAAIDAINHDRLRRWRRPEGRSAAMSDLRAARGLVSPSGEFLILRRAGVFAALDAWVASGASFELASALP